MKIATTILISVVAGLIAGYAGSMAAHRSTPLPRYQYIGTGTNPVRAESVTGRTEVLQEADNGGLERVPIAKAR